VRNLSIGIDLQSAPDIDNAIEHAKIADDAGVDALFVPEAWGRDAFTILAVLARETRRIKLGTSIVNVYSRSPGALAQHFATLDELSGGRMIIGLGTSGHRVIEHFHGVEFGLPLARLREYVEIINMLMRQEPLHYAGRIFNLERGFKLRFEPLRDHIPIWIASLTPKSVKQTAEIADGWLPIFIPKERWKDQLGGFFDAVKAAGRKAVEGSARRLLRCRQGRRAQTRGGHRQESDRRECHGRSGAHVRGTGHQRSVLYRADGRLLLRALRSHGLPCGSRCGAQGMGRGRLRRGHDRPGAGAH
jgi:alkanesulfonate monooxygenase SsuD/methylene tetrahydromethanopterin reductase-like flavin-dependent oxidoreductase (luciferase family)